MDEATLRDFVVEAMNDPAHWLSGEKDGSGQVAVLRLDASAGTLRDFLPPALVMGQGRMVDVYAELQGEEGPFVAVNLDAVKAENERRLDAAPTDVDLDVAEAFNNPANWMSDDDDADDDAEVSFFRLDPATGRIAL